MQQQLAAAEAAWNLDFHVRVQQEKEAVGASNSKQHSQWPALKSSSCKKYILQSQ